MNSCSSRAEQIIILMSLVLTSFSSKLGKFRLQIGILVRAVLTNRLQLAAVQFAHTYR
jgi:hypothetical protein